MTENHEHGQGENLVVVYQASDEFIANIIKGFLEEDGIPVVLESRMIPWMDGVMKMGEGYWGDVVVPEQYEARSKQLIEDYHASQVDETMTDEQTQDPSLDVT